MLGPSSLKLMNVARLLLQDRSTDSGVLSTTPGSDLLGLPIMSFSLESLTTTRSTGQFELKIKTMTFFFSMYP